ncbi:MAG: MBL fold metallo-hydrolase [Lachnospiraceae bacterium]|nr:MBL fold metallo-hydrolase [Lachnospiraceae bacterium]
MAYEIIKIDDRTWTVEDQLGPGSVTRFFILAGEEKALMIDAGMNTKDAKDIAENILKEAGLGGLFSEENPMLFAITHGHGDHLGGADKFNKFHISQADWDAFHLKEQYPQAEMEPIFDGFQFDLGGRIITVFENPGHSPGSVAYLDETNRLLFTGDSVQNGHVFMMGAIGEEAIFGKSLLALEKKTEGKFDKIYGCHGTAPLEPDQIRKVAKAWEKIQKCEHGLASAEDLGISFSEIEMNGKKVKDYDCKDCFFFYG